MHIAGMTVKVFIRSDEYVEIALARVKKIAVLE